MHPNNDTREPPPLPEELGKTGGPIHSHSDQRVVLLCSGTEVKVRDGAELGIRRKKHY